LTPEEAHRLEEFLTPSHIVVVATIGRNGMPHLTPNWYAYANGRLMISTTRERVKYRNLRRDNRMTVCVYSEPQARGYVTLWGHVRIRDDASIWPDTRAIVERYVPAQDVEARLQQLRTQNRVILDLTPERILFRAQVKPPQCGIPHSREYGRGPL
jgi:PPOX class probable F420-dependent enzyme